MKLFQRSLLVFAFVLSIPGVLISGCGDESPTAGAGPDSLLLVITYPEAVEGDWSLKYDFVNEPETGPLFYWIYRYTGPVSESFEVRLPVPDPDASGWIHLEVPADLQTSVVPTVILRRYRSGGGSLVVPLTMQGLIDNRLSLVGRIPWNRSSTRAFPAFDELQVTASIDTTSIDSLCNESTWQFMALSGHLGEERLGDLMCTKELYVFWEILLDVPDVALPMPSLSFVRLTYPRGVDGAVMVDGEPLSANWCGGFSCTDQCQYLLDP